MTAAAQHRAVADAVGDALDGQRLASRILDQVRNTFAEPDTLYFALQAANTSPARLRGFCRALQKSLEAAHGSA